MTGGRVRPEAMSMPVLASIMILALAAQAGDEIVIVAKDRGRCDLSIAGRVIRDPEFRARAAQWAAGRAIRVVVPAGTPTRCLAKIMFKMNDYGIKRAEFVDDGQVDRLSSPN